MSFLQQLWNERHFDWAPVLAVVHGPTSTALVESLNGGLATIGWPTPYPDREQWAMIVGVSVGTLLLYFLFFEMRNRTRSQRIESELTKAKAKVARLEEKLQSARQSEAGKGKEVRIWMDGAFDMLHYGHMNAFRQGRALGTYLVVGVNSDASIKECKGTAPVMSDEERLVTVQGCKFVDEVVPECPYVMNDEYLSMIFDKYKIDYVVHGDDPCIVDGKNVYQNAIDLGKYRTIPRTEGVSTTDIVGRMLLFSRDHHDKVEAPTTRSKSKSTATLVSKGKRMNRPSNFLTTSNFIQLFSQPMRVKPKGAKVVYIDGAWDMFHAGHVKTLQRARSLGDYLIVGVVNDEQVNKHRGANYPIMNLNERVLSVVGCQHADDVLIDAPWEINADMIKSLGINLVVAGTTHDESSTVSKEPSYKVAKEMGIFKEIPSESTLTVSQVVERILDKEAQYREKYEKKTAAEEEYYQQRYHGEEEAAK